MKRGYLIIALLVFVIAFVASCTSKPAEVVCNKPYIVLGTGCCLDENDNNVCDNDENAIGDTTTSTTPSTTTSTTLKSGYTYTGARVTSLGISDAPVKIAEYGDFSEVITRRFYDSIIMYKFKTDFIDTGKVYLEYKHYVFTGSDDGKRAAEAAECAADQGKFWAYQSLLFEYPTYLKSSDLKENARKLGINLGEFGNCLDTGKYAGKVENDYNEALKFGADSKTPLIVINGVANANAALLDYNDFKDVVNAELTKKGAKPVYN